MKDLLGDDLVSFQVDGAAPPTPQNLPNKPVTVKPSSPVPTAPEASAASGPGPAKQPLSGNGARNTRMVPGGPLPSSPARYPSSPFHCCSSRIRI